MDRKIKCSNIKILPIEVFFQIDNALPIIGSLHEKIHYIHLLEYRKE